GRGAGSWFRYVDVSSRCASFEFASVEVGTDGSLSLTGVPRIVGQVGTVSDSAPTAVPPAGPLPNGIAVVGDCDCTVFVSDPTGNRIWRIDDCSGEACPVSLSGPGSDVGQISQPRGLAAGPAPTGWRLYIADTGNHRVQVVDAHTQQILNVWANPVVRRPVDVAAGRAGDVYVVDTDTPA